MKTKGILAGLCLAALVFAVAAVPSTVTRSARLVKQNGGSTGDSITAAADTSSAVLVPADAKSAWINVIAACSTSVRIHVEGSWFADSLRGTSWSTIFNDSTSAAGDAEMYSSKKTEALSELGDALAGLYVRVITDPINTPATTNRVRSILYWEVPR